jgi:hypothetical protein
LQLPALKVYSHVQVTGQIIVRTIVPESGANGANGANGAGGAAGVVKTAATGSGSKAGSVLPVVGAAKGKILKGGSKKNLKTEPEPDDGAEDAESEEDELEGDNGDEAAEDPDNELAQLAKLQAKAIPKKGAKRKTNGKVESKKKAKQ